MGPRILTAANETQYHRGKHPLYAGREPTGSVATGSKVRNRVLSSRFVVLTFPRSITRKRSSHSSILPLRERSWTSTVYTSDYQTTAVMPFLRINTCFPRPLGSAFGPVCPSTSTCGSRRQMNYSFNLITSFELQIFLHSSPITTASEYRTFEGRTGT